MIIDIPSQADFEQSGIAFLNLAWDSVVSLIIDLEVAHVEEWDDEGVVSDEYWRAAQRLLATAIALAQQGIEFLLKSRIAAVSPFLLIAGNPNDWPRGCNKQDTPFANFRTIDAQDLIRVYDTVANTRLPTPFKERYEHLRRLRNTVMHTVDKQMRVTAKDVLVTILEASHDLLGPMRWIPLRRQYLENAPASVAFSADHVEENLIYEVIKILDILQPSEAKHLLGLDKRQRRYICPSCANVCSASDLLPNLAQLRPNDPKSTNVYCIVCDKERRVKRVKCRNKNCKGNVIDEEEGVCLICYSYQRDKKPEIFQEYIR